MNICCEAFWGRQSIVLLRGRLHRRSEGGMVAGEWVKPEG